MMNACDLNWEKQPQQVKIYIRTYIRYVDDCDALYSFNLPKIYTFLVVYSNIRKLIESYN